MVGSLSGFRPFSGGADALAQPAALRILPQPLREVGEPVCLAVDEVGVREVVRA